MNVILMIILLTTDSFFLKNKIDDFAMKVFAVHNIKGGVGKTTTTVNLAYLSAKEGYRTLVWDLDPQGGASFYLNVNTKIQGGGKALINRKTNAKALFRLTGFSNLDMLPADFSYRKMETHLMSQKHARNGLNKILQPLASRYDHIFLDCPPGISITAENIFHAADYLVVPVIPTILSLRTYNQLIQFLEREPDLKKGMTILPFFSIADAKRPMHKAILDSIPQKHANFLTSAIPDSSVIEAMGIKCAPIFQYARQHPAVEAYQNLWKEINNRCNININHYKEKDKKKLSFEDEDEDDDYDGSW